MTNSSMKGCHMALCKQKVEIADSRQNKLLANTARVSPTLAEARTFADLASVLTYRHLLERLDEPPDRPLALRLQPLGQTVYCRPGTSDAFLIAELFLRREAEKLLRSPIPRDGRVLDLGANIGLTMALFAARWPDARILGVELDPGNAEVCRLNIQPWRDRCELLVGAVWDREGEVHYTGDSAWALHVSVRGSRLRTPAFTMPSILGRLGGRADFVKMDIEGGERRVLRTLGQWSGNVSAMRVEIHEPYTAKECRDVLNRHGFQCRVQGDYVVAQRRRSSSVRSSGQDRSRR
jgi:FkbM family methyltransferase